LREAAELVVQEAWQESLLPREEEGSDGTEDHGPPLDNSTIHWKPLDDGIVLLELFGGIGTSLATILQARIKVQRYVYIDTDEAARQVAKHHSRGLRIWFPELLTTTAISSSFSSLISDISLISEKDLHWLGHVDLVIAGWPCQGMSMAGNQNGLQDGRSSRFYDMVRIICYFQTSQRRPPGYIVENVPVVSSSRSRMLESMYKIHGILGVPVLIDAAAVGSRAHRPRFCWTNLAPAELLQSAIGRTRRPDVYVSDILDPHRTPQRVYHDDQVPLAVVNRKGEPRRAFPTLVSFARLYSFKDNGPGLIWDSIMQEMVEPNADERERAMDFPTGTTNMNSISEQ
jgi:site-specific DNA-cytosine methylase